MNCLVCRGACCEAFSLRREHLALPSPDVVRWLELHAAADGPWLTFDCRCRALTTEGRCAIYQDRPDVCRDARPGAPDCLEAVRQRRSPEEYARIREASDPAVLAW